MEIPVFLFTGFLESGKTTFIQETLEDERFNSGEKILLIVCEEGFTEFDMNKISNVVAEVVEKEEFIPANLNMLANRHKPQRILIEYNGMWDMSYLYENIPSKWTIYQHMNFFDSNNALTYNANMRNLVSDKLMNCDMTVFNRMDDNRDVMELHKLVRALNRQCEIIYEYKDGSLKVDDIEDPLPFDINASVIEIEDKDFAIWYANLIEHPENYIGKKLSLKGVVAVDDSIGKNAFVIGRHVMTCCVEDIEYKCIVCLSDEKINFKTKEWKKILAKVEFGMHNLYDCEGPLLRLISWEDTQKPEDEVATFY